jgi:hypothetical protein
MSVERIQLRRGSTSAWEAANPTLYLGEFGVERTVDDEVLLKVGDGETSWNSLPYISADVDLSGYYTSTQTDQKIALDISAASAILIGQLASKSDVTHNHALATLTDVEVDDVTSGQYLKFDGSDWVPGSVTTPTSFDYEDLTNVPTTFTPSSHIHAISDITNLQTSLDGKASSAHTHAISDTTGLQSALDGKAASSHTHTKSQITDFSHTHVMSDITDLSVEPPTELADTLIISPKEKTLVSATAATGTINIDVSSQSDVFYTSSATGNFVLNIRGNGSTTLASILDVGQSLTVVFKNTNGSTGYYLTGIQIDGSSVTPKWLISAPSYGTPSGVDSYSITITKTASAPTYVVFASQAGYV